MSAGSDSRYVFSRVREQMRQHGGAVLDFAFGADRIELPGELEREARADPAAALRRGSPEETSEMIGAARDWLARNFALRLDEASILPVPGGRAAMGALTATLIHPGDRVLVTEPGYPAFERLARQAHASLITVAQDPRRNFDPSLDPLDGRPLRLVALNYPNNPTGSVASAESLSALTAVCDDQTVWFNDATYAALTFDDRGFSLLAVASTTERPPAIELHSLGKLLPLGPMSTAFLAGDPALVGRIREYSEFAWSPLSSLQVRLGTACLAQDDHLGMMRERIRSRVDRLAETLDGMGFEVFIPRGGLYMLTRSPSAIDGEQVAGALEAARLLLDRFGLAVVPFDVGEDRYLRFSALYRPEDLEGLLASRLAVQP